MRSALSSLEVVRPRSLAHALRALEDAGGRNHLVPLAGGTDLFVYLNAGSFAATRFLDLWPLKELKGIRVLKNGVSLGALATFREIRAHRLLARRFPALVAAAAEIGAWQIQNRATLGGNIANASPAGDSLPVLLAHDAVIHARSVGGAREIPFEHLYRDYRDLALEPGELITAAFVPFPAPRSVAFFRKVGTRRAQSISKVVFAGLIAIGQDGRVSHARLAYGSVAPMPVRARAAEQALVGARPSPEVASHLRDALARDIAPIDDLRSSRAYRLAIAGNLLEQFLRAAAKSWTR